MKSEEATKYSKNYIFEQGRSFAKQVEGAEPVKTTQSTIKVLEFPDSSSVLTHFPAQVVGAQAHTTEYETTPLFLSILTVASDFFSSSDFINEHQAILNVLN